MCPNYTTKRWRAKHHDLVRKEDNEHKRRIRLQVLTHYSNGETPSCACCGETYIEFLAIDHVDGGGTKHRKEIKVNGGTGFYQWLKQNNYPEGFRVLCHNCNFALGHYGYCPHNVTSEESPATSWR